MKNALYKAIRNYCDENHCWKTHQTAKAWNEMLGTTYSPATFTALVKDGRLGRDKYDKSYSYWIVLDESIQKAIAEEKRAGDISMAKYTIENYDKLMARYKEYYESSLAVAAKRYENSVSSLNKELAEAKALLGME